jgi:hypothetical protein
MVKEKVLLLWFIMQKTNYIARISSTFLMCVIMVFTVFGKNFSSSHVAKIVKETKTEKRSEKKNAPKQFSVTELAVVQASAPVSLDYHPDFVFFAKPIFVSSPENQFQTVTKPLYQFSFHEILFEHFIATNAP